MKTGFLGRIFGTGKRTLGENIALCIAAALSGTFYYYEYFYETWAKVHTLMCLIITLIIAVVWISCSFFSGKNKQLGFIIFAFLYWSFPYIYILYYSSRDNLMGYSEVLAFMNKVFEAMLLNPFTEAAKKLSTSSVTLAAIMLVLVMLTYIVGDIVSRKFRNSHKIGNYELLETEDDEIDDESLYNDIDDLDADIEE